MFKPLAPSCLYCFNIDENSKCFQPGQIAQINDDMKVSVFDGLYYPIGVLNGVKKNNYFVEPEDFGFGDDNGDENNSVSVFVGRGIYTTSQYEMGEKYLASSLLYVNRNGNLTTRKTDYLVGLVISFIGGVLEFEFFGDAQFNPIFRGDEIFN